MVKKKLQELFTTISNVMNIRIQCIKICRMIFKQFFEGNL